MTRWNVAVVEAVDQSGRIVKSDTFHSQARIGTLLESLNTLYPDALRIQIRPVVEDDTARCAECGGFLGDYGACVTVGCGGGVCEHGYAQGCRACDPDGGGR